MAKLFGTDGIRGLANRYPMDAELAFNLGRAIGYYNIGKKNKNILIGRDTRISGSMLKAALTAGLCSMGSNVLDAGIITTPAIGYLTRYYKANMGVVISASHNPYYDNGIKLFRSNGFKLDRNREREIEEILFQEKYKVIQNTGKNIGQAIPLKDALKIYQDYLIASIPQGFIKPEYRVILDCANGSASKIAPELFAKLKIDFKAINDNPNGININQECGSTCMHTIQKEIIKERADFGLAFDGDADRVLAVDEKGQVIDGDQIMAIYAHAFLREGKLGNKIIVTTHMSNLGFDETIQEMGGTVVRTDIGDKFVLEKMLELGSCLGGEQSGHIIFLKYSPNGDGLITTFQLLDALNKSKERISIQAGHMKKYYQKLFNYQVSDKKNLKNSNSFQKMVEDIQKYLDKDGRSLVRFSGTENKIRILLESKEEKKIIECQKVIEEYVSHF